MGRKKKVVDVPVEGDKKPTSELQTHKTENAPLPQSFAHYKLTDASREVCTKIRESYAELYKLLKSNITDNHRLDKAVELLESSSFWAIKSVCVTGDGNYPDS